MADKGKYIVVFKQDTPADVIEKAANDIKDKGGEIGHRYDSVLKGFSATVPDHHLGTLDAHEHVDYIESDGVVTTCAKQLNKFK
ncbi:uncharacterized protein VTP21DRAFT_4255 [Calcarisporiella thermophila]|uniref:uncharacterized protein n=1 Tax=Calcarisporiella thermophila TaxID=911321 RepID=UPI003742E375